MRRGLGIVISNWARSAEPPHRRLVIAARNLSLRIVRRDLCCGHHGEPGC